MSKNKITVLLVEDEQTLAMIIKDTLEENDFIIHTANDGEEGLSLFFELHPDVVVADVMMPKMDGFEMVRRIRQTDKQTPVLFLTARSAINDVVEGFELGANDYLKKPFGIQELIIRIKALMGKAFLFTENKVANHFEIGSYLFDPVAQTLLHAGTRQELSHRESEILKRLCENRNQVVNTQDVLLELWGDDSFFNSRSLHVFITKLRHKLSMKKLILFLSLILSVGFASAQSEIPSDSIRRAPSTNIKEFGGFLLDMGLMNVATPELPKFNLDMPNMTKDYNQLFRLNTDITYSQGFTDSFSSSSYSGFAGFGYGYGWGLSSSPQFMQMGSFKLKNGMRINTYGDYNKDGWRVPNRSAMPWERNNFRGAFELKSANGNFGIRIEVQQGRNVPY